MTDSEAPIDDERAVELSSIAAIYPEISIDPSSPLKASLDLPVAPSTPLIVYFHQPDTSFPAVLTPPTSSSEADSGSVKHSLRTSAADADQDAHQLSYLPSLTLDIDLPKGYPSEKPPIFKISTNPPWLPPSAHSRLIDDGTRLWEEGGKDLVVYTYIDHLQQGAETAFGLNDTPDGEAHFPRDLKIALLDFNKKAEREIFEQETFECGVCLEPKKGANCHRLQACAHVFCIPCLQDFYNACITEGDVDSVRCPAPNCAKEQLPEKKEAKKKKRIPNLSPSELLQIPLEQETVQRYVFLKRKKRLEADKTTIYCPRKWCQGAARSKKHPKPTDLITDDIDISDQEDDDRPVFDPLGDEAQLPPVTDRVSICEDCGYAFCAVCKKGWHGELVRCFPRREAELSAEEKATEEYLRRYTSPCPTCSAPCQKQMGCNHMICFKCSTHFCYLCSAWLCQDNPYRHFNDIDNDCFNRLWDMEGGDGIDPVGAEALHQIPNELLELDDGDDAANDHPAWEFDNTDDGDGFGGLPPPPPPAPIPPGRLGQPVQQRRIVNLDAVGRAAAAEQQAQARAMAEVRARPDQIQQQQRQAQERRGLQRFLDLVQNDREDEWDSDELDDDF